MKHPKFTQKHTKLSTEQTHQSANLIGTLRRSWHKHVQQTQFTNGNKYLIIQVGNLCGWCC